MRTRILICVLPCFAVLAASACAQAWLRSPRMYDFTNAEFVAIGDENADGHPDLIRFGYQGGFQVMWNDGTGQLTAGPLTPTPAGAGSRTAYADVTGDGIRDVVYGSAATIVVRAGLGGGFFAGPVTVSIPGNVMMLAGGDADGDGPDDLAVAYFTPGGVQQVAWVVSNGGAYTVNPGPALPTNFVASFMAVLDFGGNGVDDIALNSDGSIRLLPTVAAAPTLGAAFTTPAGNPMGLCAADFDGDGDPDLVVAGLNGTSILLVRLTNTAGSFTQGSTQSLFASSAFGVLFAGDIDGDGAADLLFRGYDFASSPYGVIANDGTGTFSIAFVRYLYASGQYGGAGFADLNGDGFLDFVGSCDLHFGDGTFTDPFAVSSPVQRLERDWDDDGDLDYWSPNEGIWRNDGRGNFTIVPVTPPPPPPTKAYQLPPAVDDFDGDGVIDYPAGLFQLNPPFYPTFIEMRHLHGNGDGTMTDVGVGAPPGLDVGGTFTDDVDGDGDGDLAGVAGIFLNDGTGFFTQPPNPFAGWRPIEMRDVDGDGDQDFLATAFPPVSYVIGVALIRRTGPAAYAIEVLVPPGSSGFAGLPSFADVDGDGDQDIALDSAGSGPVSVWTNSGGAFGGPTPIALSGQHNSPGVGAADVDGDGLVDLVLAPGNRIAVHRQLSPGVYEAPRSYAQPPERRPHGRPRQRRRRRRAHGAVIFNRRFHGAAGGFTRQYGLGSPGSSGFRPVLGIAGPTRPGTIEHLHVTRCIGGGSSLLVVGATEANIPNFIAPGLTAYIGNFLEFLPLTLAGAPGQPGVGSLHVAFGPLPPAIAGVHYFVQVAIADPGAPSGLSHTNGLEMLHGF